MAMKTNNWNEITFRSKENLIKKIVIIRALNLLYCWYVDSTTTDYMNILLFYISVGKTEIIYYG